MTTSEVRAGNALLPNLTIELGNDEPNNNEVSVYHSREEAMEADNLLIYEEGDDLFKKPFDMQSSKDASVSRPSLGFRRREQQNQELLEGLKSGKVLPSVAATMEKIFFNEFDCYNRLVEKILILLGT